MQSVWDRLFGFCDPNVKSAGLEKVLVGIPGLLKYWSCRIPSDSPAGSPSSLARAGGGSTMFVRRPGAELPGRPQPPGLRTNIA
jgi:hypothetical protein